MQTLAQQMRDIYTAASSENRALTESENSQLAQLRQELSSAEAAYAVEVAERCLNLPAGTPAVNTRAAALRFAEQLVNAANGNSFRIAQRSFAGIDRAGAEGDTGVTIGDIIEPLEKGNILGFLGCHIQTGLSGDWKYPVISAVEAEIAGETAEIADSAIEIGKVTPVPHRCGISILVSNGALNATNDELRDIVLAQIVVGLDRALNKWMFKRTAIASGVNGLFVQPGTVKTMAVSGAPTYAEILALKGAVDATGVKPDGTAAYVMGNAMKAYLEGTPKVNGAAGMICENGKINGVPVFVTEYAPANAIEFGYFSYALVGQFGVTDIIVDRVTKATSNCTRFVLNTEFDIKAARAQAFGILESGSGSGSGE